MCESLDIKKGEDLWDIGTGTGLIALKAKQMGAKYVLATDFNPYAVKNARENSKFLNLEIDVRKADVFGDIKRKFDVITFNPPFTNNQARKDYEISFWDKDNKVVKRFFSSIQDYLKPNGRAFIAWSSFGKINILKKIAKDNNIKLIKVGRKISKRGWVYYVFKISFC